jgi:16S rRNA (uracil1498-N3)-methyltransferase
MPRFYCPAPLVTGQSLDLPAGAARHIRVLRLQPGERIVLFNGEGGEYEASIERIGRSDVRVEVARHSAVEREGRREVQLVVGMPANERMDWLVEKATELGAAGIQPVCAGRSVLKLKGERAGKKQAHWQAIAIAACEQCGRNRVPVVREVLSFGEWAAQLLPRDDSQSPAASRLQRLLLSLDAQAQTIAGAAPGRSAVCVLSGPEGGFTAGEEDAAVAAGFRRVNLGPRVLRAETAPLAALALLA